MCALSLLEELRAAIVDGTLEVWKFKLISLNLDRLKEMLMIMAKKDNLNKKVCSETDCVLKPGCIEEAVTYRTAEVQAYEDQRRKIHEFLRLCERIPHGKILYVNLFH